MRAFTTVYKKELYLCEVTDAYDGGFRVSIYRERQGREPKQVFNAHTWDMTSAMMQMEKFLPDANWKEKEVSKK